MMSLLRTALFSLFSLMTFATSASAECAWVLWDSVQIAPKEAKWFLNDAYRTQAECARNASEKVDVTTRGFEGHKANGNLTGTVTKVGDTVIVIGGASDPDIFRGQTNYRFVCLPDTVDPRGPKGAGR